MNNSDYLYHHYIGMCDYYDKKYEESVVLAQENSRLREQISALKEKNTHLKEKQSMQDGEINHKLTDHVSTTSTNLGSE